MMRRSSKRIVITGGHAVTTAVATVEELISRDEYDIHWIGARSAVEGKKIEGIESIVFPELGVKLHSISTGRVQRKFTRYTIPSLLRIPVGIVQAFFLLGKIKPDIVVSFGGFAGFPVVLAGFVRGIPIILHEQTIAVGLANKVSAWFATKVAIAREQSKQFFDEKKVILTGNPVMKSIRVLKPKLSKNKPPVIFITCGSRGSQIINQVLKEILPQLTLDFKVIHLTGKHDFEEFRHLKLKHTNYHAVDIVNPLKIAEIYEKADIVICRAGANTVSELLMVVRPAILIPIPWTRYNEQQKNAETVVESGFGTIINQDDLKGSELLELIRKTNDNWEKLVKNAKPMFRDLDQNAAAKLSDLIEKSL